MPKIIELTVELEIQRVSCPGVWLCQDGRVSLTVFALGTNYQTCLLPPMFPLMFKDVFYFRKRFQETCALNNICCLLKDETIFCELVQWCEDCNSGECTILAQYLGALNDVLFPPNMCSNEGIDLLMRRSNDFPGILSPKIEIATKVRIDEVWNSGCHSSQVKTTSCNCSADADIARQRQVCHTPMYHRVKCSNNSVAPPKRPRSRPRSRSRSDASRSCASLREPDMPHVTCKCPNSSPSPRSSGAEPRPRSASRSRRYEAFNVDTRELPAWLKKRISSEEYDDTRLPPTDKHYLPPESKQEKYQKIQLESRYIEEDNEKIIAKETYRFVTKPKLKPCVCEICRRYHELFHSEYNKGS